MLIAELVNCSRHLAIRSVLSRRTDSICRDMDEVDWVDSDEDEEHHTCEHCVANHAEDKNLHPSVITGIRIVFTISHCNSLFWQALSTKLWCGRPSFKKVCDFNVCAL